MEYISPHRLQCNRDVEDADEDTLLVRELSEISNDCLGEYIVVQDILYWTFLCVLA